MDKRVFIVGAGPTGLTLAIALRHVGYDVTVIEKHSHQLPFSRAMLINATSLQLLDKYGLAKEIRNVGCPLNALSVFSNKSKLISADLAEYASNPFHPVIIPQNDVEIVLRNNVEQMGCTLLFDCTYESHEEVLEDGIPCLEVTYLDDSKVPVKVKTGLLCGADGFKSSVRSSLQIPYPGTTMTETMIAADVTIPESSWSFDSDLNVFFMGSVGVVLAIRLKLTKVRLAGSNSILRNEMLSLFPIVTVDWISEFAVNHFHATSHGSGNIWLAGDAVHVHSPVGGRGMNMGIADAIALAHAIQTRQFEDDYVRLSSYVCGPWLAKTAFQMLAGVQLKK